MALYQSFFINKIIRIISYSQHIYRDVTVKEQGQATAGSDLFLGVKNVDAKFEMKLLTKS